MEEKDYENTHDCFLLYILRWNHHGGVLLGRGGLLPRFIVTICGKGWYKNSFTIEAGCSGTQPSHNYFSTEGSWVRFQSGVVFTHCDAGLWRINSVALWCKKNFRDTRVRGQANEPYIHILYNNRYIYDITTDGVRSSRLLRTTSKSFDVGTLQLALEILRLLICELFDHRSTINIT
jgi:hypothetical protein